MANETVDLQRLLVSLEASFVKYERAWQRAQGFTDEQGRRLASKYDGITKRINGVGQNTAGALRPVQTNTANIAAQFQDIAVQLQSGQSPFTIALQQGTQLSAALGAQGGGLKGAIAGIGTGLASMINPLSLATIGFIALGGVAVQYFATMINEGRLSAEELKKQEDLIRRVADRWGEAVPALKAYVDELDRAKDVSDAATAGVILSQRALEPFRAAMATIDDSVQSSIDHLNTLGSDGEVAAFKLTKAYEELRGRVSDGTATQIDFQRVLEVISSTAANFSVPAFSELANRVGGLAAQFAKAADAASLVRGQLSALNQIDGADEYRDRQASAFQFAAEQERINGLTTEQLALETEIGRVKSDAEHDGVVLTEKQALEIAKQRLAADERRAQIKSSDKAADRDADRERQAVEDLIADLQFEAEVIGLSAIEKEKLTALRRAGAAATEAERLRIVQLIEANQAAVEAQERLTDQMQELRDVSGDALKGFISDLRAGKPAGEAFANVLDRLADRAIDMAINFALDAVLPGAGGAKSLLGFASGTANTGGSRGQVRGVVHGQEAVIPLPNGGRIPVDLRVPSPGGAAGKETINIVLHDDSGRMAAIADQRIRTASGAIVQVSVTQSQRAVRQALPGMMTEAQARKL